MDASFVADDHKWTFTNREMNFNKNLGLEGKYCYHPFNTITVDQHGDVYMCICQAWLPISVGKIWEFDSFEEIAHSPKALEIQGSIIDGSYKYCDHNTCSIIKEGELSGRVDHKYHTINWINFAVDNSCNLTCPSCRKEFVFSNEGPDFNKKIKIIDHIRYLIEKHPQYLKFTLSGDGDPFASLVYRHFLTELDLKNKNVVYEEFGSAILDPSKFSKQSINPKLFNLRKQLYTEAKNYDWDIEPKATLKTGAPIDQKIDIEIITNGILLKAHWHKLLKIHENIIRTKISFDAGSEEVYNITRRGGDWNKLLESAKFISKWKQKTYSNMTLTANFVVQTSNYKDMPAYVELCDKIGFDEINFQKIVDWGTFANFNEHAVWKESHPLYNDFLQVLEHPSLNNKKINFTNLK